VRRRRGCTVPERGGEGAIAAIGACSKSRLTPADSDFSISVVLQLPSGEVSLSSRSPRQLSLFGWDASPTPRMPLAGETAPSLGTCVAAGRHGGCHQLQLPPRWWSSPRSTASTSSRVRPDYSSLA